jgi:hypothetical protein
MNWRSLEDKRKEVRLVMMYKVVSTNVAIAKPE